MPARHAALHDAHGALDGRRPRGGVLELEGGNLIALKWVQIKMPTVFEEDLTTLENDSQIFTHKSFQKSLKLVSGFSMRVVVKIVNGLVRNQLDNKIASLKPLASAGEAQRRAVDLRGGEARGLRADLGDGRGRDAPGLHLRRVRRPHGLGAGAQRSHGLWG